MVSYESILKKLFILFLPSLMQVGVAPSAFASNLMNPNFFSILFHLDDIATQILWASVCIQFSEFLGYFRTASEIFSSKLFRLPSSSVLVKLQAFMTFSIT
jgi:hypothetical protein